MALTKEQKKHLYYKLLDMQKELSGEKKETESMTEEVGELSNGVDNHMADHGTLVTDRMTDQTVRDRPGAVRGGQPCVTKNERWNVRSL